MLSICFLITGFLATSPTDHRSGFSGLKFNQGNAGGDKLNFSGHHLTLPPIASTGDNLCVHVSLSLSCIYGWLMKGKGTFVDASSFCNVNPHQEQESQSSSSDATCRWEKA